jgi:hypothetical protein
VAERVERNPDIAFERSDWPIGTIALVIAAVLAVLVIAPLVLLWAYPQAVSDVGRGLAAEPPAPRLQVDPERDLARFRAEKERQLNTYYWVDKAKGVVHIPIAQAMRNVARQGIAGWPKGRAQP